MKPVAQEQDSAAPWRALRLAAALLAVATAVPVCAQAAATPPPAASAPQSGGSAVRAIADAELLARLRAGGLVIYFRHTATDFSRDDRAMADYDDCAQQRPLSPKGQADARAIGAQFKRLKIPVGQVLASPYCRTREVAQLMFGRYERSDAVRGGPAEAGGERYAALKALFASPVPGGLNRVISSHGNPFRAVAGPPYMAEGEAAVIRPLGQASWEIVARLPVEGWERLGQAVQ